MPKPLSETAQRMLQEARREKVVLLGAFAIMTFLAFHNLEYAPRPWQDEGAALSLSKALVKDGVYAVRSSEGYQTFGPAQSIGPTVLLPIALSFKLLGIGLLQGRVVMAVYTVLTLVVFYALGRELFEWRTSLIAVALLIGSPAVAFLQFGRQVLGDVPALGLFLACWLVWLRGVRTRCRWLFIVAGLLLGAAMVTKSQYTLLGFGALALLVVLDLFYYRQSAVGALMTTGLAALACVAAWTAWQLFYFGSDTYQENFAKLSQLADITYGFDPSMSVEALKLLIRPEAGHFYYLWGFPALIYVAILSTRRDQESLFLALPLIFTCLWLGYYLLLVAFPWPQILFAPVAVSAFFVGKLWHDLTNGFTISWHSLWTEIRLGKPAGAVLRLATLTALGLMVCYPLQGLVRNYVLAQDTTAHQLAAFLNESVDKEPIIETWERELGILTDHRYHFPDQSLLAQTHALAFASAFPSAYRGSLQSYVLGADYFERVRPAYVVVGWYARLHHLYDADFLAERGCLLATIGHDGGRYEVYELMRDGQKCP